MTPFVVGYVGGPTTETVIVEVTTRYESWPPVYYAIICIVGALLIGAFVYWVMLGDD